MAAVKVLDEYCKSCGLCVEFCPRGALSIGQQLNARGFATAVFDESKGCSGCGNCTTICPDAAIVLYARTREQAVKKTAR